MTSSASTTITNGAYVQIGTGPLAVQLLAGAQIYLVEATTQPANTVAGHLLQLGDRPFTFNASDNVWAMATGSASAIVEASPIVGGAGANIGNVGVNNNPVGSAAFAASQAPIGTSASQIVAARAGAAGTGRIAVTLYNAGSATVYFGNSGVLTTTGMPLPAGAAATISTTAAIYGIASTGTQTIGIMETF